ncbi:hypothetical protein JW948_04260 [bacterium]|nr:hypothetical protein [bacterium]
MIDNKEADNTLIITKESYYDFFKETCIYTKGCFLEDIDYIPPVNKKPSIEKIFNVQSGDNILLFLEFHTRNCYSTDHGVYYLIIIEMPGLNFNDPIYLKNNTEVTIYAIYSDRSKMFEFNTIDGQIIFQKYEDKKILGKKIYGTIDALLTDSQSDQEIENATMQISGNFILPIIEKEYFLFKCRQ